MKMEFKKATKEQSKLRLALAGPAGHGKTYSSLAIATHLVPGGRVAVIDTERGSASKYSDIFEFDVLELASFAPTTYVEAIHAAEEARYDVIVIDSLSHAWMGKDGALEKVDLAAKRSSSGNSYTAWREVTPAHNSMVDAIVGSRCHIIATLRAKTEYVTEPNDRGKMSVRKVGLAPVQRDGLEYEFDLWGMLNEENELIVHKTRCSPFAGQVVSKPGEEMAAKLRAWLTSGSPAQERKPAAAPDPPKPPTAAHGEVPVPDFIIDDVMQYGDPLTYGGAAGIYVDRILEMADDASVAYTYLLNKVKAGDKNASSAQLQRDVVSTLMSYVPAAKSLEELREVGKRADRCLTAGSKERKAFSEAYKARVNELTPKPPGGGEPKPETKDLADHISKSLDAMIDADGAKLGINPPAVDELPATQLRAKLAECTVTAHLLNTLMKHGPGLVDKEEGVHLAAERMAQLGANILTASKAVRDEISRRGGWKATRKAA